MPITLLKENNKGKTYQADGFKILYRNKGTVAGDNDINTEEHIYLISGSAEITLEQKIWKIEAPAEIHVPAKTYHKILAITDIAFIIFE